MQIASVTLASVVLLATYATLALANDPLRGAWTSNCQNQIVDSFRFDTGQYSFSNDSHIDEHCIQRDYEYREHGYYRIGAETEPGTWDVDVSYTSIQANVFDENLATVFNFIAFCGFRNWKVGVSMSLMGARCDNYDLPQFSEVRFLRFRLNDGTLFRYVFTPESNGTTEEKRPITLDDTHPFRPVP